MNSKDSVIGQRVLVKSNGLTALIVGRPEYYTPRSQLIRIKYENSTKYEYMIMNQLELLPQDEQFETLGGKFVRPKGYF